MNTKPYQFNQQPKLFSYQYFSPYKVFQIDKSTKIDFNLVKSIFNNLILKKDQVLVTLSREYFLGILDTRSQQTINKFQSVQGDNYCFNPKTISDLVLMNHLPSVKEYFSKKENVKYLDAMFQNVTLLYICSRSGYYELAEFLIQMGADVNQQRVNPVSSNIHAASYYGHQQLLELLTKAGADTFKKNQFNHSFEEEAQNKIIQTVVEQTKGCKLDQFIRKLRKQDYFHSYTQFIIGDQLLAQRLDFNPKILPEKYQQNYHKIYNEQWQTAYHGTKLNFIQSIIQNGLLKPGQRNKDNVEVQIPLGHIPAGVKVAGISNWSDAIFASPSLNYVNHYAQQIIDIDGKSWSLIFQLKIQPGAYGQFANTLVEGVFQQMVGENAEKIQWRIEAPKDPFQMRNSLYRIEQGTNIIVQSLLLVQWSEFEKAFDSKQKIDRFLTNNKLENAQKFFFIFACEQELKENSNVKSYRY